MKICIETFWTNLRELLHHLSNKFRVSNERHADLNVNTRAHSLRHLETPSHNHTPSTPQPKPAILALLVCHESFQAHHFLLHAGHE